MSTKVPAAFPTREQLMPDTTNKDDYTSRELEVKLPTEPRYSARIEGDWNTQALGPEIENRLRLEQPELAFSFPVRITAAFCPPNDEKNIVIWFLFHTATRSALNNLLLAVEKSKTFGWQKDSLFERQGETLVMKVPRLSTLESGSGDVEADSRGTGVQKGKAKRVRGNTLAEQVEGVPLDEETSEKGQKGVNKRRKRNKGKGKAEVTVALPAVEEIPKLYTREYILDIATLSWRVRQGPLLMGERRKKFEELIYQAVDDVPRPFEFWWRLLSRDLHEFSREHFQQLLQQHEAAFLHIARTARNIEDKFIALTEFWATNRELFDHFPDGHGPGAFGSDTMYRAHNDDFVLVKSKQLLNKVTRKIYAEYGSQTDEVLPPTSPSEPKVSPREASLGPTVGVGVATEQGPLRDVQLLAAGIPTLRLPNEPGQLSRNLFIAAELCRLPLRTLNVETVKARMASLEGVIPVEFKLAVKSLDDWLALAGPTCDHPAQTRAILVFHDSAVDHLETLLEVGKWDEILDAIQGIRFHIESHSVDGGQTVRNPEEYTEPLETSAGFKDHWLYSWHTLDRIREQSNKYKQLRYVRRFATVGTQTAETREDSE